MALNVLFINASLTDGGSEKALALVAQALAERGHDVTMALVRDKERTYTLDAGVSIIQMRYPSQITDLGKLVTRIRQTRRVMKRGSYDYVVCYMWDLNLTTLVSAIGTGQKVIVSERAHPGSATRGLVSRMLQRVLYKLAWRIVYQTNDAQSFCPRKLRSKSVVIPNMIPIEQHPAIRTRRGKTIVSAGRLSAQKNFPLLIRAFARFLADNPGWTLQIYGKGTLEQELRELIQTLGVANSVHLAGYVPDLSTHLRTASMFVLSSDFEGISNAMTEAMASGTPTICTDCPVGGAALLINHGVSGLLVPVRDEDALVSAMSSVAASPELADRLSQGARRSVLQYSPDALAEVWEQTALLEPVPGQA